MNRKNLILLTIRLLISENTLVHINSTYFDGQPKEVIIYEYEDIYKDNSIKIIDKLHFDRQGKLIFNYSEYFSGRWETNNSTLVTFSDNKINFLEQIDGCLDCIRNSNLWSISFVGNQLMVETMLDNRITGEDFKDTYQNKLYKFKVTIISPTEFQLITFENTSYTFIKVY